MGYTNNMKLYNLFKLILVLGCILLAIDPALAKPDSMIAANGAGPLVRTVAPLAGPKPIGAAGNWIGTADYPAAALRAGKEGTIDFSLAVDSQGKPTECLIRGSSGSDDLDTTTCQLLMRRANFTPALDAAHKPIAGVYSNRVRWAIPLGDAPLTGSMRLTFMVERDGTVSDCKVELTGQPAHHALPSGSMCPRRFKPYLDPSGQPLRKRVETMLSVQVASAPADAAP
ncbi:MAG: hypothetical protein RLZZ427_496 [Pseudomonadota bacterium]|jgi:protein TonB